jgi:UDP-N-acetylglucosamine:LPS N-acetylglucosamine transferase
MLVMPEHTVEQRLNAAAVETLGIGRRVTQSDITAEAVASFVRDADRYRETMRGAVRDGRVEALAAIERFAHELHAARPVAVRAAWEPA